MTEIFEFQSEIPTLVIGRVESDSDNFRPTGSFFGFG
jgi:hypothetical protein